MTINARVYAQTMGYPSDHKHLGAPPVFYFEPHQTEMCQFKPDVILDITPVFETKVRARPSSMLTYNKPTRAERPTKR